MNTSVVKKQFTKGMVLLQTSGVLESSEFARELQVKLVGTYGGYVLLEHVPDSVIKHIESHGLDSPGSILMGLLCPEGESGKSDNHTKLLSVLSQISKFSMVGGDEITSLGMSASGIAKTILSKREV